MLYYSFILLIIPFDAGTICLVWVMILFGAEMIHLVLIRISFCKGSEKSRREVVNDCIEANIKVHLVTRENAKN